MRKTLAAILRSLGGFWLLAGVLRVTFGVGVRLLLLPPIDLEKVEPIVAFGVGAGLVLAGAWMGRAHTVPPSGLHSTTEPQSMRASASPEQLPWGRSEVERAAPARSRLVDRNGTPDAPANRRKGG